MNSRQIVLCCLAAFLILPDPFSFAGGWGLVWLGWLTWGNQFGWSINFANYRWHPQSGWTSFTWPTYWVATVALEWILPLLLVALIMFPAKKGSTHAKVTSIISIALLVILGYIDWHYLALAGGTVVLPIQELLLVPIAVFSFNPPSGYPLGSVESTESRSSFRSRLCSFLGSYEDWLRYCFAPILVGGVRIIGAWLLYPILSVGGTFSTPWMAAYPSLIPASLSWLWLFNAWDSLKFPTIAMYGYSYPNHPYLPAYPVLIFLTGRVVGNYWLAAFLVGQVFALGSVVMFQLLAEQYIGQDEALYATLLMMMFPFVNVFMTLSYSEPLFIFSSIGAWYFYKKEHLTSSSLLAGVAAVTRIYGVAIVLPIILDILKRKRYGRLGYLAMPTASLSMWFLFCYLSTGDPLASWTDERAWGIGDGIRMTQAVLQHGLTGFVDCCSRFDPTIFWALAIFAVLIVMVWKVDRLLWLYSAGIAGLLLVTTSTNISLLRYFAFIFPIWLTVRVKNPVIVAVGVGVLAAATVITWLYTIAGVFLG